MRPQLPPYTPRPEEDLVAKCARLRAELRAVGEAGASNDNDRPRVRMWWEERD